MSDAKLRKAVIQDHAAFLDGEHDFQDDILKLAGSDLVGTILETVMLATSMRFAAVARVTNERWVACRTVDEVNFGLAAGDEIDIQSTFCQTVRDTSEMVLFNDVSTDEVYLNHPIAAKFGIVSYASIPIYRSDGSFFGTLCAIDTVPRNVKHPRAVAMLEMFADAIGKSLETEERLEAQEQLVAQEREMARIQDEFVAVLGHDLRNPVAALHSGLRLMGKQSLPEGAQRLVPPMLASLQRMGDLIDNIMMHAKARLGGGIRIEVSPDAPLAESLNQIVEEVRAASEREILLDLSFDQPVCCDAPRVSQAIANLLSNAVRHSTPGVPVRLSGKHNATGVEISVANQGEEVPEDMRQDLFHPFRRGTHARGEGLGLGLYIADSIAKAHGGQIDVTCEDGTTTFTFRMP
ncbi:GAF domain-containing sensor histidine kinase [Neptunicoccus cionae]|uniref:GAF domain-containing sensor histidine kinase n=1 Tax=Neptunicoccus cionae TaxID=2035344 RepID=UPI000C755C4C|nr:GAF domain-containing sensor histidine kinase [Amylibacter cionae]PLS20949.1 histidine kinase [Amylibacter cionae]